MGFVKKGTSDICHNFLRFCDKMQKQKSKKHVQIRNETSSVKTVRIQGIFTDPWSIPERPHISRNRHRVPGLVFQLGVGKDAMNVSFVGCRSVFGSLIVFRS